jgi:hypothetical protein
MKKSKKEEIIDMRARDRLKEQATHKKFNPALANQVQISIVRSRNELIHLFIALWFYKLYILITMLSILELF